MCVCVCVCVCLQNNVWEAMPEFPDRDSALEKKDKSVPSRNTVFEEKSKDSVNKIFSVL